jgi:hypothetical protein
MPMLGRLLPLAAIARYIEDLRRVISDSCCTNPTFCVWRVVFVAEVQVIATRAQRAKSETGAV